MLKRIPRTKQAQCKRSFTRCLVPIFAVGAIGLSSCASDEATDGISQTLIRSHSRADGTNMMIEGGLLGGIAGMLSAALTQGTYGGLSGAGAGLNIGLRAGYALEQQKYQSAQTDEYYSAALKSAKQEAEEISHDADLCDQIISEALSERAAGSKVPISGEIPHAIATGRNLDYRYTIKNMKDVETTARVALEQLKPSLDASTGNRRATFSEVWQHIVHDASRVRTSREKLELIEECLLPSNTCLDAGRAE